MATVLHFFTLPELADELEAGDLVRVEGAVTVRNGKTPGLGVRDARIHARAVMDGSILTYMLPVGSIQTLHGEAADNEAEELLEAEYMKAGKAVTAYLEGRGFEVRPGLIDIGGAEPVRGTWAGLEAEGDGA